MNQIALISKEIPRNDFFSFKIGDFNPLKYFSTWFPYLYIHYLFKNF